MIGGICAPCYFDLVSFFRVRRYRRREDGGLFGWGHWVATVHWRIWGFNDLGRADRFFYCLSGRGFKLYVTT